MSPTVPVERRSVSCSRAKMSCSCRGIDPAPAPAADASSWSDSSPRLTAVAAVALAVVAAAAVVLLALRTVARVPSGSCKVAVASVANAYTAARKRGSMNLCGHTAVVKRRGAGVAEAAGVTESDVARLRGEHARGTM